MKKWLKSYHIFLSAAWLRWCVYLVYPLAVFLLVLAVTRSQALVAAGLILGVVLSVSLETVLDYCKFGGITAKDTNKLEYLKTSVKGLHMLQQALWVDEVRRMISIVMILVLPLLFNGAAVPMGTCVAMVAVAVLFTGLGVFLARKLTILSLITSILMVGNMLAAAIAGIVAYARIPWWLALLLLAGACGAAYLLNNRMVMKKAGDSYYDERD